ncbi:MAG: hypothetical protein Q9168_006423 [Polycauliona sp. 1 TL-2023]
MDSVGAFGRTVADAVHGLTAIAGKDKADPMTEQAQDWAYGISDVLASRTALQGAKFGLPWSRCWDSVAPKRRDVALRIFQAMEHVGAEIIRTEFPSSEDRIASDGSWDWKRGEASGSEFTIVKTDAYSDISAYLSQLSGTAVKSVEDVLAFNIRNAGTEGAQPGDVPAFPSGQDNLQEVVNSQGVEDDTYLEALRSTRYKCRDQGIDAALQYKVDGSSTAEFDALILCDRKGAGQQLAAQAGLRIHVPSPPNLD